MKRSPLSKLVLALVTMVTVGIAQPALAVNCTWTPRDVTVWKDGWLVLRVANDQGTEKILRFCTMKAQSSGAVEPEACSASYSSAVAALAIGAQIRVTLTDSTLDTMGVWSGTCDSIVGQTNLDAAVFAFAIKAPS